MTRSLVHIATGPENPTRAALGLLVGRAALETGHEVDLFIAGDGVGILRPETLDAGHGMSPPDKLVELTFAADRVLTY